jgi:hypothetical protein
MRRAIEREDKVIESAVPVEEVAAGNCSPELLQKALED